MLRPPVRRLRSLFWLPFTLLVGGVLLTGCGSTAPVVESINTPDTLQTNKSGSFQATIQNQKKATKPLSYTWNFGDGKTGSGLKRKHKYSSPGRYTVRFRAKNKGGADSSRTSVKVVRAPQPAQITSINATPNPVDAGKQVKLTSNVTGDSPITYNWSFGDGNGGSSRSATHTYKSAGTYTVRLQASNKAGKASRTLKIRVKRALPEICRTVSEMNSAFFGRNSSTLTAEAKNTLRENSDILKKCPGVTVRVEGFAAPGERNAKALSTDRAEAVAKFYRNQGVSQSRIATRSRGTVTGVTTKKGDSRQYRRADSIPKRTGGK